MLKALRWQTGSRSTCDVKCRLVRREFPFLEERDDVFASGTGALTNKPIDIPSMKDSCPEGPLVTFVILANLLGPEVRGGGPRSVAHSRREKPSDYNR